MMTSYGSKMAAAIALMLAACSTSDPPVAKKSGDATPLVAQFQRDHGWAALHAERYGEAASYFQRILKVSPDDAEALIGLGEAYLGEGRLAEALVEFERLDDQTSSVQQAKALQGQGLIFLHQGDQSKAKTALTQAVEQDAALWRSWNALGRIRDAEQDYDGARQAYRKAIALNPKAAFLHNNLGFSLLASGEPLYAEEALNRALALDPDLAAASTNLRLALALQGRYGQALAGTTTTDRAVVMNNVGYGALLRGDHDKAKSLFQDAMKADPGFFGEAKQNLAFLETLDKGQMLKP